MRQKGHEASVKRNIKKKMVHRFPWEMKQMPTWVSKKDSFEFSFFHKCVSLSLKRAFILSVFPTFALIWDVWGGVSKPCISMVQAQQTDIFVWVLFLFDECICFLTSFSTNRFYEHPGQEFYFFIIMFKVTKVRYLRDEIPRPQYRDRWKSRIKTCPSIKQLFWHD